MSYPKIGECRRLRDERRVYRGFGVPDVVVRVVVSVVPRISPETTSSTRRFCWRPAAVELSATGIVFPKPWLVTLVGGTPSHTRKSRMAPARFSDSLILYSSPPT